MEKTDDICCPKFDPTPWDDKQIEWENKQFIQDKICTFMYMPLNFGSVMTRLDKKVKRVDAQVPEWLCLSEHTSMWNMNVYLAVNKQIEDAKNISISGKFYSKVYEGSFSKMGEWEKDFKLIAQSKGFTLGTMYMWYTTCPKCAKKYGKNYVVIISEIK